MSTNYEQSQILARAANTAAHVASTLADAGLQTVSVAANENAIAVLISGPAAREMFDKHLRAFHAEYTGEFEVESESSEEVTMGRANPEDLG